ncbi:hypothetical protein E4T56_gene9784 [Termitomyces sp. T112]|nr:hypothetical protein E4T56_gene9784 [Termitomyces sp. T112]
MVLPTLINSGASSTFVSNQLDLLHDTFDKFLKLQLFNRSPVSTGITQYHDSALTLNNKLGFQGEDTGSAKELPPHHSYYHKIDLEESTSPTFGKIYNMSKIKLQALKDYLDDMLSKGFICSSISTAGTLVLFAKKKDGFLQLCVNYWGLNKVTKKNQYSLPLIRDLVDHLCNAKIYTKIDLHSCYNNIWIALEHE